MQTLVSYSQLLWHRVCSLIQFASDVPGPSLLSSSTQHSSAKVPTPSIPPQSTHNLIASKPNYDPFASLTSSHPISRSSTPPLLQSQHASQSQRAQPPQPSSDPFAILSSTAPRQPSPFSNTRAYNLPASPPAGSIYEFAHSSQLSKSPNTPSNLTQQSNGAFADDDWDFTSALPDDSTSLPSSNDLIVSKTSVTISFQLSRPKNNESVIAILVHISNNTSSLITEYAFQVAISKVYFPP